VFYASSFLNPKAIIDIATLTGAQLGNNSLSNIYFYDATLFILF
jgi:leucyl aminopeptidase